MPPADITKFRNSLSFSRSDAAVGGSKAQTLIREQPGTNHHLIIMLIVHIVLQLLTIAFQAALKGPVLLVKALLSTVKTLTTLVVLNTIDFVFFLINILTPLKPKGTVVAPGDPGHQGIWPEFKPSNPNFDSRSPCPYLSALFAALVLAIFSHIILTFSVWGRICHTLIMVQIRWPTMAL